MPLIRCPDCENEVSDLAPACPRCGRPVGEHEDAAPPSFGDRAARLLKVAIVWPLCIIVGTGALALTLAIVLEGESSTDKLVRKTQRTIEEADRALELRRSAESNPGATRTKFARIWTGMSYDQVAGILGERGEETARSSVSGTTTTVYQWRGRLGGAMLVTFQDGKVVSKAQSGLQ